MKPSVGRIVHFWYRDYCNAAIITKVNDDESCSLTIFWRDGGFGLEENVFQGSGPDTWHQPERVD